MEPELSVNPDFAVAEGAAIQAAIIEGLIDNEESLVVTDVNPYTLGVLVTDGISDDCMSVVIPRNVTIPVMRSEIYYTYADGQTEARIRVEFSYNLNGMLEVEAKIVSTGKQASIEIDMMEGEKSERIDVSMWKDAPGAKAFRTVIRRAERRLRELEENEPLLFEKLEDSLYHLKEALIKGDMEQAKEEEEFIMELLEE